MIGLVNNCSNYNGVPKGKSVISDSTVKKKYEYLKNRMNKYKNNNSTYVAFITDTKANVSGCTVNIKFNGGDYKVKEIGKAFTLYNTYEPAIISVSSPSEYENKEITVADISKIGSTYTIPLQKVST